MTEDPDELAYRRMEQEQEQLISRSRKAVQMFLRKQKGWTCDDCGRRGETVTRYRGGAVLCDRCVVRRTAKKLAATFETAGASAGV